MTKIIVEFEPCHKELAHAVQALLAEVKDFEGPCQAASLSVLAATQARRSLTGLSGGPRGASC